MINSAEQSLQLPLPFTHTENSLKLALELRLGKSISLTLTQNSTSMLSVRTSQNVMQVRLHRIFLNADTYIMEEIVSFLKKRRRSMPHFQNFVRENREHLTSKPPKRVTIKSAGRFFDLRELYDEINKEYFGGTIKSQITWGAGNHRYAVRKRTLGSYSERLNMIRINPILDKKNVPRYYVSFIVYHEMLHAAIGISKKGNRRCIHPREFRRRERLFKDYQRAAAWERGR